MNSWKEDFSKIASLKLSNWKTCNKNELINSYIKYEGVDPSLADAYLAAIICRYQGIVDKQFATIKTAGVSKADCWEWFIEGVLYTLEKRVWLDPTHKLYADKNGPDKAMNRRLKWSLKVFYQYSNHDCRKVNYTTLSTDALALLLDDRAESGPGRCAGISDCIEKVLYDTNEYKTPDKSFATDLILRLYKEQNYFLAFMVDIICYYDDVFKPSSNGPIFSRKKLAYSVSHLGSNYAQSFAHRFNVSLNEVAKVVEEHIFTLSSRDIRNSIARGIIDLEKLLCKEGLC